MAETCRAGDGPLPEDFYNVNQSRSAGDPMLRVQIPADVATVTVTVEDLALRGGASYGYRLNARSITQDFQVVLNTQSAALQLQNQVAQARVQVNTDLVGLYKALGGGWQEAAQPERNAQVSAAP